MNDYEDIEKIKEDFWERIRPKSQKEVEDEQMMLKVKEHYYKLIDGLLREDAIACGPGRESKAAKFTKIKQEMDDFILGLENANN